jgi:hypothetical protein
MSSSADDGSVSGQDGPQDIIAGVMRTLQDFDNTPPTAMTPLFYQHGFEELNIAVRDLLRLLGHDPDV